MLPLYIAESGSGQVVSIEIRHVMFNAERLTTRMKSSDGWLKMKGDKLRDSLDYNLSERMKLRMLLYHSSISSIQIVKHLLSLGKEKDSDID
jgi:hypothetical protein